MKHKEPIFPYQFEFQSGTRVETPCGKKGIVNFFNDNNDECRVYYDKGSKTKSIMAKISECRILTVVEAMEI